MAIEHGQFIDPADFVSDFIAGEAIAAGDAVAYCVTTDGTAGLTANRLYKASAAALTQRLNFIGFAMTSAAAAGIRVKVSTTSIYDGLSGLTADTPYYLSDTQGQIATSAGTYLRWVGISSSTTRIDRLLSVKRVVTAPIGLSATTYIAPFDGAFSASTSNSTLANYTVNGVVAAHGGGTGGMGFCRAGDTIVLPSAGHAVVELRLYGIQ